MTKKHFTYTVHEYPHYKLERFNGLDVIDEKFFNTITEVEVYLSEHRATIHKSMYKIQLQKSTNMPYKLSRNLKRYKLTIEGMEPEYFLTIKEISQLTGEYFGLIRGKIIKVNN
jgi:hypothetical protein